MKKLLLLLTVVYGAAACNNSSKPATVDKPVAADSAAKEKASFFPVTAYLRGQLYDIRNKGVTPLKYITVKEHTDSAWIKLEELDGLLKEFLTPEIDSLNLVSLFTEKKFLDQTIDAFTFTYEPTGPLPDSMHLKRWDVYINPETNKVKRIYLVKEIPGGKTLQLTWQSDKWCKTVTILNKADGSAEVEKEEKISWDF